MPISERETVTSVDVFKRFDDTDGKLEERGPIFKIKIKKEINRTFIKKVVKPDQDQ
jgi:hypothetical protein